MTKEQTVDKDRRIGWLRDLEVGDKVLLCPPASSRYLVGIVEKITPSGLLTVGGRRYGSGGRTGTDSWSYFLLVSADPERIAKVEAVQEKDKLIRTIINSDLESISVATLEQIIFMVKMDAENTAALEKVTNS